MVVGRSRAAVLLRPGQSRVPGLAERAAPLTVVVLESPSAALRRAVGEVLRDEVADLLPEGGFLGGVAQVHAADPTA